MPFVHSETLSLQCEISVCVWPQSSTKPLKWRYCTAPCSNVASLVGCATVTDHKAHRFASPLSLRLPVVQASAMFATEDAAVSAVCNADREQRLKALAEEVASARKEHAAAVEAAQDRFKASKAELDNMLEVQLARAQEQYLEEQGTLFEHAHMGYLIDVKWFLDNGCAVSDRDKVSNYI